MGDNAKKRAALDEEIGASKATMRRQRRREMAAQRESSLVRGERCRINHASHRAAPQRLRAAAARRRRAAASRARSSTTRAAAASSGALPTSGATTVRAAPRVAH
jgi:peptidoglycan hydrolase CwlO-like protein